MAYSLDNKVLAQQEAKKDAASGVTEAFTLDMMPLLKDGAVVLVKLELHDSVGKLVSTIFTGWAPTHRTIAS